MRGDCGKEGGEQRGRCPGVNKGDEDDDDDDDDNDSSHHFL